MVADVALSQKADVDVVVVSGEMKHVVEAQHGSHEDGGYAESGRGQAVLRKNLSRKVIEATVSG